MRKNLKIGLFGFGCVGQGLYHVLEESQGVKAEIRKICIKNPAKERILPAELFTTNKEEILNDPQIDVVVELIDDASAAFEIVATALRNGKAVVTANKKMLAEHLGELYALQQQTGKPLLYEGSVCGSIPIIRNLEEYYDNDLLSRIEGIFNGSTNYILTRVFEEQLTYAEALRGAQEKGFAESDPRLDVEGFDPKFKLVIAIAHTFGLFVTPERVINLGINRISDVDLKFARENGYVIRLIARSFRQDGKIYGFVAPQYVDEHHPFAPVRNEFNAVQVTGAFAERQLFIGKGAGSYPTGSAVLSDISALTYDYAYEYKKLHQSANLEFSNDLLVDAHVSFGAEGGLQPRDFEQFHSGYAFLGRQYMVGKVHLEKLLAWASRGDISIILSPDSEFIPAVPASRPEVVSAP